MDKLPVILWMMSRSWRHKDHTPEDILRVICPPLALNQYYLMEGRLFISWGWFSDEVAQGYRDKTRKLMPDDWKSGSNLWLVNVIALDATRELRWAVRFLRDTVGRGNKVNFRRTYEAGGQRYGVLDATSSTLAQ